MVTARGTETDKIVGLEIGADDYVVKPFSAAEVIARIRAVLRRVSERGADPREPIRVGDLEVDLAVARASRSTAADVDLSRKEFDLLAELARHAGNVVRREDLMARVWDENWFGSTKTLDVHVGWLRRKLGDPKWIETVRGVGFRLGSAVALRTRLLLALAYVLVLAVVALGVPLGATLADRVDAEVRSDARGQADLVAASASDLLEPTRARCRSSSQRRPGRARARDRRRRRRGSCSPTPRAPRPGATTRRGPRSAPR